MIGSSQELGGLSTADCQMTFQTLITSVEMWSISSLMFVSVMALNYNIFKKLSQAIAQLVRGFAAGCKVGCFLTLLYLAECFPLKLRKVQFQIPVKQLI